MIFLLHSRIMLSIVIYLYIDWTLVIFIEQGEHTFNN